MNILPCEILETKGVIFLHHEKKKYTANVYILAVKSCTEQLPKCALFPKWSIWLRDDVFLKKNGLWEVECFIRNWTASRGACNRKATSSTTNTEQHTLREAASTQSGCNTYLEFFLSFFHLHIFIAPTVYQFLITKESAILFSTCIPLGSGSFKIRKKIFDSLLSKLESNPLFLSWWLKMATLQPDCRGDGTIGLP